MSKTFLILHQVFHFNTHKISIISLITVTLKHMNSTAVSTLHSLQFYQIGSYPLAYSFILIIRVLTFVHILLLRISLDTYKIHLIRQVNKRLNNGLICSLHNWGITFFYNEIRLLAWLVLNFSMLNMDSLQLTIW